VLAHASAAERITLRLAVLATIICTGDLPVFAKSIYLPSRATVDLNHSEKQTLCFALATMSMRVA
jgi:hypothetical protein